MSAGKRSRQSFVGVKSGGEGAAATLVAPLAFTRSAQRSQLKRFHRLAQIL